MLCSGCKKTPFMLEGCKERGDDVYKEWLEKCIGGGFFIGPQLETEEEMVQRAMGSGTATTAARIRRRCAR